MRTNPFVAALFVTVACVPRPKPALESPPAKVPVRDRETHRVETDPPRATGLTLTPFLSGLSRPVVLTHAPGDARIFVVEQAGRIRIVKDGVLLPEPFLDLTKKMPLLQPYSELGLLGVAFHPQYATNGRFFVSFADAKKIVVASFTRKDADHADPASEKALFEIALPFENQHGGSLAFGPDGLLYAGFGDGGGEGDPKRTGQDTGTLLGKLVRLDVSQPQPKPEIFALGFHNPWNLAFDRETGLLWIGDSGEKAWEEIDVLSAKDAGRNYGWSAVEGPVCFNDPGCDLSKFAPPVLVYPHRRGGEECSIIGGFVYRGKKLAALRGHYLYADYCAGWIRSLRLTDGGIADHKDWTAAAMAAGVKNISAFGADAAGEAYVLDVELGKVWRLE